MIQPEEIHEVLRNYDYPSLQLGVLGSHSALDTCDGAVEEGFHTVVWAQRGRETPYMKYFKTHYENDKLIKGCVDNVRVLEHFKETSSEREQSWMRNHNVLFIPNRAFVSYNGIETVENEFLVPLIGSRNLLGIEERGKREKDYYWLLEHEITNKDVLRTPQVIKPKQLYSLDELVIVKIPHAKQKLERGFFTATSYEELLEKARRLRSRGILEACPKCHGEGCEACIGTGVKGIHEARIEKYSLGPVFNFDFFYSPINKIKGEVPIELLGVDARFESSLDGMVRLPAKQQLTLRGKQEDPTYIVVGHHSVTVRESILQKAFDMAEEFVRITQELFEPGIIGPFTIQTTIEDDQRPTVYDISTRVGGGTNAHMWVGAPYGNTLWRSHMSTGRRLAIEVKRALREQRLEDITS